MVSGGHGEISCYDSVLVPFGEATRSVTYTLRDSQGVALERLCESGRTFAALWAEPRSGKTAVALRWLQHIRPKVVVIIGPLVAESVWRTEAAKWLQCRYQFHPLTKGNAYPDPNMFVGITILFVNYEQFWKQPYKRLRPYLAKVAKWCDGQGAMILDESHLIKTPNSITGKNIRPLAHHWHYRLLLTGTPVTNPNQVDAVYGQWTFLDPSIRDLWTNAEEFRYHFGEWTTVKGYPELIRPRNQYELNKYLQPNVITMTGAGDPVPIKRVMYDLPAEVQTHHNNLLKHGVIDYGDHTVAALNPLTRLLRMRTLVTGWCKDDEDRVFTVKPAAHARLKVLGKVLRKCEGKVIVACTHLWEVRLVQWYLRKCGIRHISITGATKNKDLVIERFQRVVDIQVLVVQPRTVAMAVDISVANDLVWYSSDFNYVTFKQASDRIKLSPASPQVWFLCARNSVDEDVWVTLQEDHQHLKKVVARIKNEQFKI